MRSSSEEIPLITQWLNGLAIVPTLFCLLERGLFGRLAPLASGEGVGLIDLAVPGRPGEPPAHLGNLCGALRTLALQGWLRMEGRDEETTVWPTAQGIVAVEAAAVHRQTFRAAIDSMKHSRSYLRYFRTRTDPEGVALEQYGRLTTLSCESWGIQLEGDALSVRVQRHLCTYLDGLVMAPTLVALGRPVFEAEGDRIKEAAPSIFSLFDRGTLDLDSLDGSYQQGFICRAFELLTHHSLIYRDGSSRFGMTPKGRSIVRNVANLGMPVSYLPAFERLDDSIFGSGSPWNVLEDEHLDRLTNIWGSAGSTTIRRFQEVIRRDILTPLFDRRPLSSQPAGIADLGCGAALPLKAMVEHIIRNTYRGRCLDRFPLVVLGADYSRQSRQVARENLAGLEATPGVSVAVIPGDVSDPAEYDRRIRSLGFELGGDQGRVAGAADFLHVMMFLMHDRELNRDLREEDVREVLYQRAQASNRWALSDALPPSGSQHESLGSTEGLPEPIESRFTTCGAEEGKLVRAGHVAADLVELVRWWMPHLGHGLVLLEPHVPRVSELLEEVPDSPATAMRIEFDPSPAVWGAHYLSGQYLMPLSEQDLAMTLAGLTPVFRRSTGTESISLSVWGRSDSLYYDPTEHHRASFALDPSFPRSIGSTEGDPQASAFPGIRPWGKPIFGSIDSRDAVFELPADYHEEPTSDAAEFRRIALDFPDAFHQHLPGRSGDDPFLVYTKLSAALWICLSRYTDDPVETWTAPLESDSRAARSEGLLPVSAPSPRGKSLGVYLLEVHRCLLATHARERFGVTSEGLGRGILLIHKDLHYPSDCLGAIPIAIVLEREGSTLSGGVLYDCKTYRCGTVAQFVQYFVRAATTLVCSSPTVDSSSIFSDRDPRPEYGPPSGSSEATRSLRALFRQQVEGTPGKTALIVQGKTYSYRQLGSRADRLARHLRDLGLGPEDAVAVCLAPSFELVIALIAILEAGCAYVALAPGASVERYHEMLEDSRAKLLLVSADTTGWFRREVRQLDLEDFLRRPHAESEPLPFGNRHPESLFSVVYTSSSTGRAKGVLIQDDAVANRLHWMWREFPFREDDVLLLQKSPALVGSLWEYFGGLLQGIVTVVARREDLLEPIQLSRLIAEHKVTWIAGSPPILEGLLNQGAANPHRLERLRFVATSAEPLLPEMLRRWQQTFPTVRLMNLYGASECSSNVTRYDTAADSFRNCRIAVGRPIDNSSVHLLDREMRPTPVGGIGEMYVAGASLARGYLNQASLTAERFLPNPFASKEGERMVRTGDLSRQRFDGNLELVGRCDHQVKIRGFRVDLLDVEIALRHHPEVRQCAVAVEDRQEGSARLVAFVVGSQTLSIKSLRSYLATRLPDYMIPVSYDPIDELPTTPSGKVDRLKLLSLRPVTSAGSPALPSAGKGLESRICHTIRALIDIDEVRPEDRLMDLDLDSLSMIKLQHEIQLLVEKEVPIALLFRFPTARALAGHLSHQESSGSALRQRSAERARRQRTSHRQQVTRKNRRMPR